jgi:hypothetical protein
MVKVMKRESLLKLARKLMAERAEIPERKEGDFHITHTHHEPGDKLMVVNFREAIFTGLPQTDLILKHSAIVHRLQERDGVWMSDLPCELVQMYRELACHAKGRVLIGGLGLGLVFKMCARKPSVSAITVVERSKEVLSLVYPWVMQQASRPGVKFTLAKDDIHQFVKRLKPNTIDVALLDTWASDGEWTWQTEVVPLRRALQPKVKRIYCWHENVMLGQVGSGIWKSADIDEELFKAPMHCHRYAFRRACREQGFRLHPRINWKDNSPEAFQKMMAIEEENRNDLVIKWMAATFLYEVGTPQWERLFGEAWDEACAVKESAA